MAACIESSKLSLPGIVSSCPALRVIQCAISDCYLIANKIEHSFQASLLLVIGKQTGKQSISFLPGIWLDALARLSHSLVLTASRLNQVDSQLSCPSSSWSDSLSLSSAVSGSLVLGPCPLENPLFNVVFSREWLFPASDGNWLGSGLDCLPHMRRASRGGDF